MFSIVFVAYAQLGYIAFGNELEDFHTFSSAIFTLFRTILGEFDYLEIERVNHILGPIYFMSYIFFVFFVLLVILNFKNKYESSFNIKIIYRTCS